MACDFHRPSCTLSLRPARSWGGLGNMLPLYASYARPAFAQNCSVAFNESRWFQIADFFLPTDHVPASRHVNCVLRALTWRPAAEVARQVDAALAAASVPSCVHDDCCGGRGSRLVALYVRSGWADLRLKAAEYGCGAAEGEAPPARADALVDGFFSLLLAPNFAGSTSRQLPTGGQLLRAVVPLVRSSFGNGSSWSLLVASDSPAVRRSLSRRARRMGIRVATTSGTVGHNNLPEETHQRGERARSESRRAATTAVADLILLSRADLMIAVNLGSSFPSTAHRMAPCKQTRLGWPLHTRRLFANPLIRSLFTDKAPSPEDPRLWPEDCIRDCLGIELPDSGFVGSQMQEGVPLIQLADQPKNMSRACRDACSCWLKATLGDGSEAHFALSQQ
ncbi:hypothetical protein AB1Y20_013086 [Prymnesium parvum]|uniref:Uncharacterized protein n=1 Tax=Prymnesium parvum TaxID=97485 RepID=A0AB34ILS2_PRYPA